MTEILLAENEILKRRVAELESERDKAITERDAAIDDMRGLCVLCKFFKVSVSKPPCAKCLRTENNDMWEWKGAKNG